VPAAHAEQTPAPAATLKVPALQFEQVEEPAALWYVPAAQGVHEVAVPPAE